MTFAQYTAQDVLQTARIDLITVMRQGEEKYPHEPETDCLCFSPNEEHLQHIKEHIAAYEQTGDQEDLMHALCRLALMRANYHNGG